MKATVILAIDLEVRVKRKLLFFWQKMYAKAVYEGEMGLDDVSSGDIISLDVFNSLPTRFVVRGIERIPVPQSSEVRKVIQLYYRGESMTREGDRLRPQTLQESVERLNASIAENLAKYGLVRNPEGSKVGPEPTFGHIPSNVGSTSYLLALHAR